MIELEWSADTGDTRRVMRFEWGPTDGDPGDPAGWVLGGARGVPDDMFFDVLDATPERRRCRPPRRRRDLQRGPPALPHAPPAFPPGEHPPVTIQADLEHAHVNLTQILDGLAAAIRAISDASGGAGYPARASGATATPSNGTFVTDPTDPTDPGNTIALTRPEQIMEAALARTPDEAHRDLTDLATQAHHALTATNRAVAILTRYQAAIPARSKAADDCPDDWCRSCWRDNQHHSPVTLRPTGQPFYAGLCRWCGDFEAAHKRRPSIEILRTRHQGKRVTLAMIDAQKPIKPTRRKGKR